MAQLKSSYENEQKLNARKENVRLYRELTGLQSIPEGRQYWTLSSLQSTTPESEINQMVDLGFIVKEQFWGVDREQDLVLLNRKNHPEAHFPDAGEWEDVILEQENFNPALIYLDTLNEAGRISLDLTAYTMPLCKNPGTVILVNVAQSSRFHGVVDSDEFLAGLQKSVPGFKRDWQVHDQCFDYCGSVTTMRTYAFCRRAR